MRFALVLPTSFIPQVGGRIRFRQWINLLSRKHELEVFACQSLLDCDAFEDQAATLSNQLKFKLIVTPAGVPTYLQAILPRRVQLHSSAVGLENLVTSHAEQPFDAVIFEHSYSAFDVSLLSSLSHRPAVILDEHNIESSLLRDEYRATDCDRVSANMVQVELYEEYERRLWRSVDHICTVSPLECRRIGTFTDIPVSWVPMPPPSIDSVRRMPDRHTLLFVGNLGFAPNVDAVKRLRSEILPLVRCHFEKVRLEIVGWSPCREVLSMADERVHIYASVDSVGPFLSRASIAVQPIRFGAGVKLKALEALSARVPLVTSSHVAGPLGLKNRVHACIADSSAEIAGEIVSLLANPDIAESQAEAGFQLSQKFDAHGIDRHFESLLMSVVSQDKVMLRRYKYS